MLTQVGVGLRKFNFHKVKHNFRETLNPLCAINNGVKDAEHYFLLCHAYDVFRNDLLNSANAILLPYGIICPSNEELLKVTFMAMNSYLLIQMQKFSEQHWNISTFLNILNDLVSKSVISSPDILFP